MTEHKKIIIRKMTTKIKQILILIFVATLVLSCVKLDPPDRGIKPNEKLNEITVPGDFNWSTSTKVEVSITGLPTVIEIKNTLKITLAEGTTLYSALHNMSENVKISLTVPNETNSVVIIYGATHQNIPIVNKKAEFSFIPVVEDTEL
jgi:hypothetical protein